MSALSLITVMGMALMLASPAGASTTADDFTAGNLAYEEGRFEEAIAHYLRVEEEHGVSGGLLYNLGNAWHEWGHPGRAVLSYERARRLAPFDPEIVANLATVRREAGLHGEIPAGLPGLLPAVGPWAWGCFAAAALAALALLVLGRELALRRRDQELAAARAPLAWRLTAGAAAVTLGVSLLGAYAETRRFDDAVIVAPDAKLLISPFAAADSTGALAEGRLVDIDDTFGDFFRIRAANGQSGWLPARVVERIQPQ